MRLIDADALYEKYEQRMKELLSFTTLSDECITAEAISLLNGSLLIREAPSVEENGYPVKDVHTHSLVIGACGYCGETVNVRDVYCGKCGRKLVWGNANERSTE